MFLLSFLILLEIAFYNPKTANHMAFLYIQHRATAKRNVFHPFFFRLGPRRAVFYF